MKIYAHWDRKGQCIRPIGASMEDMETFNHGDKLLMTVTKQRSAPHHRMFFALINTAFHNWPETYEFQPDNAEHLRAWLEIKAEHREVLHFEVEEGADPKITQDIVQQSLNMMEGYAWVVLRERKIWVTTPKTIQWSKMGQKEFNEVSAGIFEIIEEIIGVPIEELQRGQK